MKTIITLLMIILVQHTSAQDLFYYYQGEKIPLQLSTEKVYVKFKEGKTENEKKQIIASIPSLKPFEKRKAERQNNVAVIDIVPTKSASDVKAALANLNRNKDVIIANPFIVSGEDSILQGITDHFIVKLKSPADFSFLQELATETNTQIIKQNDFEPSVYILIADKNSKGNALEMANYFHETRRFEFAEPSFLRIVRSQCSNDPLFNQQWGLLNTGQNNGTNGADINICQAWGITRGRDVVSIAVIDEGVDLNHPDLINNLLPGFDATGNGSNGAPQGNDAHGTACAGIIAASGNNGIGISGVAPNCRIIPVRVIINGFIDTDIWAADGINWSWQNGADILSNSWRFGTASNLITTAINNATTQGRGGLGCPVLFAAGNFNSGVVYPASLQNTIAVGAISMCNERKRSSSNSNNVNPGVSADPQGTSCDGEDWWGSCFGAELDLVAPGVLINTTDISGIAGYDNGDYTASFNGTSSACPHAAGVMALILSVNRCLTGQEARNILELSCEKVGNYCYTPTSNRPNGYWNNQMGYGRINALKAVQYAFSLQTTSFTNLSGTNQGATGNFQWVLASGGCSGLAAATYVVKRHEIKATVTYPYTQAPIIVGTSNGFSAANPNNGNYFLNVESINETSATVRTWVYEVVSTVSGQQLSWVPTQPSNIRFNFTILSALSTDIFLQNETVYKGTVAHNAMNRIEAGRDVTNAIPFGDYVVEGDANVTQHAGNIIRLGSGTHIKPGHNGYFRAYVDPFFTCTQFPQGIIVNNNDTPFPKVIDFYETKKLDETKLSTATLTSITQGDKNQNSIKNFPNPFSENTTIEYQIEKSYFVTITVFDHCGRQVLLLKNKTPHEKGTYQLNLEGVKLVPGIYHYTLQTDDFILTKQMVKID